MDFIFVENNEIDKVKWDETIEISPNGKAYVYSWYLDAVFPNWSAIVTEDYSIIFPITINSQLGVSYFFTPIYAMQLGVFSRIETTIKEEEEIWKIIQKKTKAIDLSLHNDSKFIPKKGIILQKQCQIVNLNKSYDQIQFDYNSNLKRNLTKATKLNLKVGESKNIENVIYLFRNGRGNKLEELKEIHYNNLNNLINNGLKAGKVKIYECYEDREIIASGFFSICNNRIIYHKGGANHKGRKYGAMHLIIDHILREFAGTGMVFDFGGSSIENVKKFNLNFTKEEYIYPVYKKSNLVLQLLRKIKHKIT
jgi:hypothetical protein